MAGRLNDGPPPGGPRWPASPAGTDGRRARSWLFVLLLLAVVVFHLAVVRDVAARMAELDPAQAMPARLEVTYVRTLEPAPPPKSAPRAASPVPRRASRAPVAAKAAASQAAPEGASPLALASASAPAADASSAFASAPGLARVGPDEPVLVSMAEATAATTAAASTMAAASMPTAAASTSAATTAPADTPAAFAWPASTRVTYLLSGNFRGEITGRAEVEWIRIGERYQVNVSLYAGPEFAPIFSRRMTSEGRIDDSGLVPVRYDEDTRFLMRDRRASVVFAPDSVELANGEKRERLAGVQDTASQFIQFTWLFGSRPELLRVGASFEFPLALPRSMRRWTYDVAEAETLQTSFGALDSFHLKPRNPERKPNELAVEMWFAPELRFLPVRIRIEQDASTWLDLMIARKPEIAASETALAQHDRRQR